MSKTVDRGAKTNNASARKQQHIKLESRFLKRQLEAFRVALDCFEKAPDWLTFFKEVLGEDGIVPNLFPDPKEFREFESTAEYREIHSMLAKLREKPIPEELGREPQRVITVRLPKCIHDFLKNEAKTKDVSVNQLCIAKLIQILEDENDKPASRRADVLQLSDKWSADAGP